jgi:nitrogen-specific signal transduction histidine kinase
VVTTSHMIVVFFIYGLSFFVLGVAILIYPKRNSAFALAPHLNLIAGFGITHGLNEWLDMFILIQSPTSIPSLEILRAATLPASFLFLVQFGVVSIVQTKERYALLRLLPFGLGLLWSGTVFFSHNRFLMGDIWARYLIGLPGVLLTSYALSLHLAQLRETKLTAVIQNLKFMIVVFLIYGLLAGAIVKKAWFVPASVLNYAMFQQILGLPIQIFRAMCASLLAYSTLRVLRIFYWETQHLLREGELRLRTITSAAPAILFKNDCNGILTDVEGKGLAALNLDSSVLKGKPVSDLFPDFDCSRLDAQSWASNKVHTCNVTLGDKTFDMCYSPLPGGDGQIAGFVGAALDISARLEDQARIEAYRRKLAQTKQLTELGTMSQIWAGKLRKPLNVAKLLIQRLLVDTHQATDSEGISQALERSLSEINDATSTVQQFCDQIQVPPIDHGEWIDLHRLFTRVAAVFAERSRQANIQVIIDVHDVVPCLCIGPRELEYVFSILIEHAIDSGPNQDPRQLRISCVPHSREIELVFSDTCKSETATELERAFKPFQEAGSQAWNNKLGLAVVHEIVQAKGGTIRIDSQEGQGTLFRLVLPTAN